MRKLDPKDPMEFCSDRDAFQAWIDSRPVQVRLLAKEYPIGTVIADNDGDDWYVIGWTEDDSLIISPAWVGEHYEEAMAVRQYAHAHHLRCNPLLVKKYHAKSI